LFNGGLIFWGGKEGALKFLGKNSPNNLKGPFFTKKLGEL